MTRHAFFEGAIVPIEKAAINVTNHTFNYGTGCFAGIRGYWNEAREQLYIFRMQEHYQRLLHSARLLHCDIGYSNEQLQQFTVELMRAENWRENVYIRPIVYKEKDVYHVWLHEAEDRFTMFSRPTGNYLKKNEGVSVCVSSWRRIDDTAMPARGKINGSYVNSALAKSDAMLGGYDEAILLNQDGHVSEATAANFMMVRDGVLVTPPISANLLEGVVRRSLAEVARDKLGVPVEQRQIDRTELYMADEAFFCGTGVQMAALGKIDHRTIGDGNMGPITSRINDLFYNILIGEEPDYAHWVTPVY